MAKLGTSSFGSAPSALPRDIEFDVDVDIGITSFKQKITFKEASLDLSERIRGLQHS